MAEYTGTTTGTYDTTLTRDRFLSAPISWSAIIAATLLSVAIYWTFAALGTAVGLGAYDPAEGDTVSRGAIITAGIYHLVAAVLSLYAAGYVAGKVSGVAERMNLGLHGLCTWALTMVFVAGMVGTGVGTAFAAVTNVYLPAATVAAAERSADVGAVSSWFAFFTLILGAVAAMFGAVSAPMLVYKTETRKRTSYRTSGATAGL